MTTQRDKDRAASIAYDCISAEDFIDGAEYGRRDGRKDAARRLRALLHGYGFRDLTEVRLMSFIEDLEESMTTQREDVSYAAGFVDGARAERESARKELARRLNNIMDLSELCGFGPDYKSHLKYYEETLSFLICDLNGGPINNEEDE